MKKIFVAVIFCFCLKLIPATAQDYKINLGGGLIYGTSQKNVGFDFRGDVTFFDQWSISPHFNVFFNKKDNYVTERWNAFNIDAHYFFELERLWKIYPLLGINFATVSEKVNDITFSNAEIGMNIGAGAEYPLDSRLNGFGELKYVIGDADQAVITVGLLYTLIR